MEGQEGMGWEGLSGVGLGWVGLGWVGLGSGRDAYREEPVWNECGRAVLGLAQSAVDRLYDG